MIVWRTDFLKICKHTRQNFGHVLVHDLAVCRRQNIIGTPFFVQSKRQRAIFIRVSEGKFHFIAVGKFHWTTLDAFKAVICFSFLIYLTGIYDCCIQKSFDLPRFHRQLIFIKHRLVHTPATGRKIAAHRISFFY